MSALERLIDHAEFLGIGYQAIAVEARAAVAAERDRLRAALHATRSTIRYVLYDNQPTPTMFYVKVEAVDSGFMP